MAELTSGATGGRLTAAASIADPPAGTVEVVPVCALLLGERLDTRAFERDEPLSIAPLSVPERDDARLLIRPEADQVVDLAGNIFLPEKTTERLQVVADIFAKGLVLSHYETRIAGIFDGIE